MAQSQRLVELAALPEPFDGERLREISAAIDGNARLYARIDSSGGEMSAVDQVQGGEFFRMYVDGAPVGFYVLGFHQAGERTEAVVTLAHGAADIDLCAGFVPLIERQCAQCDGLSMFTRRAGLVRKLRRLGYVMHNRQTGTAHMRKGLK
jgi:hypothetical protein